MKIGINLILTVATTLLLASGIRADDTGTDEQSVEASAMDLSDGSSDNYAWWYPTYGYYDSSFCDLYPYYCGIGYSGYSGGLWGSGWGWGGRGRHHHHGHHKHHGHHRRR